MGGKTAGLIATRGVNFWMRITQPSHSQHVHFWVYTLIHI